MSLAGKTGRHWALGPGHWSGGRKATSPRPKSPTPKAQRLKPAFSLAELMVAIGILGVGMLIIAAAFPVAIDQSRQAMELYTSKMVFDEAVLQLKTRVTWVELEKSLVPGPRRLGTSDIWLIDCSNTVFGTRTFDHDGDGATNAIPIFAFSSDTTYGWLAAVRKVGNQSYKFWIFVLREPTGTVDGTAFRFAFTQLDDKVVKPDPAPDPDATVSRNLTFTTSTVQFPGRETTFLANNGLLYKIIDYATTSETEVTASCDQTVSDGVKDIAFPDGVSGMHITRKTPVVAVYQTVISY